MTVYEFLKLMTHYSNYDNCFYDVKYEERENVLDALEYQVLTVDMAEGTIYCER